MRVQYVYFVFTSVFLWCHGTLHRSASSFLNSNAPLNWNPHLPTPGKYGALMGVTKGFGTFLCPRGWGICCFLLHQFCPWGGGLVRFWHSWTSEDWGEWVVSMCFLIPKGGFKMDDIKVLCWFIFFPIKLRAQELFIIVLKSIKMK